MATLEQLEAALRAADAAGNTDDAKRLAQAYAQARSSAGSTTADANQPHAEDVPYASGASPYNDSDLHPEAMAPERPHTAGEYVAEAGRGVTLAGRSLVRGAAGIGDIVAAPLAYGINKGLDAAGVDPSNHQLTGTEIFDRAYGATNLPVPETTAERYVDRAGQGLGGAISGAGLGRVLSGSSNAVVSGVGQAAASNPVAQGVGAVTSGLSAQAAHEADLGPTLGPAAELAAGLAGGLVPAIPSGLAGLTRAALRGGEEGRQKVAQSIDDFKAAGTTPTVGQATGLGRNQLLESTLGKTPGSASVIAGKAGDQAGEVKNGLDVLASRLAPAAEPARAGLAIERGITGPKGFVDRFKETSNGLYDQLDKYLPQTARVPVDNTRAALSELTAPIPGAPATSRFFVNGKVADIARAVDADTVGPMAPLNRPDIVSEVQRRQFAAADQNAAIERTNGIRQALGLKPKPGVDPNAEIPQLLDAATDGRLPYAALKKLRTLVGEELSNPSLASDVKSSAWDKLYSGLTEDLKGAASQAGPEAQQAWSRANKYYRAGRNRIDDLDRVVENAGGPEAVFNAATSGAKDGAFTIRRVMQSLQPDQQAMLSATVLRRLGTATAGTATEQGDFSINSFLTNWNKLSPDAKNALFDRFGKTYRDDLDAISRTAGSFRQASRNGANPSGSAPAAANITALVGLAGAVGSGHYGTAGGILAGGAAANGLARAMVSPRFVRFLAKTTNVPKSQWPAVLAGLEQSASSDGDEDTKNMAQAMRQALKTSP